MHLFGKSLERDVVIVAEIGVNHEGRLDTALELLRLAKAAGADAAKFQTFTPERYASASDPARLERVRGFDLGREGFLKLKQEADRIGLNIFSTAVSDDVVPFLAETFGVIKIASGDLNFRPVIEGCARAGCPTIISTGLGTTEEIKAAVSWFKAAAGGDIRDRLILMQCTAAYPAPIEAAEVATIPTLREITGLRVGYSNHVIGLEACFAAIALGAPVIEVHFTDCKTGREFRDHALSCDPDDMAALVAAAPRIRAALGDGEKGRLDIEAPNIAAFRKGVVAARHLESGTVLTRDDLMFARPATEFGAGEIDSLIGRRLSVALKTGELIPRTGVEGA